MLRKLVKSTIVIGVIWLKIKSKLGMNIHHVLSNQRCTINLLVAECIVTNLVELLNTCAVVTVEAGWRRALSDGHGSVLDEQSSFTRLSTAG